MGSGNCTEESHPYDVDDPFSENALYFAAGASGGAGAGLMAAAFICDEWIWGILGAFLLLLALAMLGWTPLRRSFERVFAGRRRISGVLQPGEYHPDPSIFRSGATVTFYSANDEEIETLLAKDAKLSATVKTRGGQRILPVAQAVVGFPQSTVSVVDPAPGFSPNRAAAPATVVNLNQRDGHYDVEILT